MARARRGRRGRFFPVVQLRRGGKQVVAAQRDQPQDVAGLPFAPGQQLGAKADGKLLDPDTAAARRPKMAEFMHQDDSPEHEHRYQPGQQCSHRHLTFACVKRSDMGFHVGAGHAVALVHVGQRVVAAEGVAVHDAFDQAADVQKADLVF